MARRWWYYYRAKLNFDDTAIVSRYVSTCAPPSENVSAQSTLDALVARLETQAKRATSAAEAIRAGKVTRTWETKRK